MANFDILFKKLLEKEGGYSDATTDYGNYCSGSLTGTKYGVASTAYREYYGRCPTKQEMMNLTVEQAKAIWKSVVWDKIGGDGIDNLSVAELMLDSAGGGKRGYLHIRQAINRTAGSNLVDETDRMIISGREADLINGFDAKAYFDNLYSIRLQYFETHPQRSVYGTGWINRLNSVYDSFVYTVKNNPQAVNYTIVGVVLIGIAGYFYYLSRRKII